MSTKIFKRGFFNKMPARRMPVCFFAVACALSLALSSAGCSNSSADSATAEAVEGNEAEAFADQPDSVSASAVDSLPSDSAIGQTTEAAVVDEPAYDITVGAPENSTGQLLATNALGLDIVEVSVRRVGDKKFGGVLKGSDISWPDAAVALLRYNVDPPTPTDGALGEGQEFLCDIRVKLSDGSKTTLHSVDLSNPAGITIKCTDDVAFVTFVGADGQEVSTYDAEVAIQKKEAKAKEKKAKEKKAKEEAEKEEQSSYKPPAKKKKKADDACVDDIVLG